LLGVLVVVGTAAPALTISCGPSCIDDRCSLKPATPQTTRVDYTAKPKPATGSPGAVTSGSGSAAPVVAAAGSGSGSGSGSAAPPPVVVAGSGSGSAAPPKPVVPVAPVATSASWELYSGNQFRMYVVSKASFAAGAKLALDFVKTPVKTPFVVTLETLGNGPEAAPIAPVAPPTTAAELEAALAEHGSVHALARIYGKDRRQIYRWLEQFGLKSKR